MTGTATSTRSDYVYADYVRPDILRMIPEDGKVIGSVGCGLAAVESLLVKAGRQVHGVDISSQAIEVARTRLTSARVVSPNDTSPFEPNSLDGLILADVIEHLPKAWEALRSYASAVRPGGWVLISLPNMRSRAIFWEFIVKGDWPEHPSGIFDETHIQVMTRKRLKRWCDSAGLSVERWFSLYSPRGPRRDLAVRLVDYATLGLFHEWLLYAIQAVYRKTGGQVPK